MIAELFGLAALAGGVRMAARGMIDRRCRQVMTDYRLGRLGEGVKLHHDHPAYDVLSYPYGPGRPHCHHFERYSVRGCTCDRGGSAP